MARIAGRADRAATGVQSIEDASQQATMRLWALVAPLGSLRMGAPVGATSRAWYEELRLAPVSRMPARPETWTRPPPGGPPSAVRPLVDLPLPSSLDGDAETLPLRLVDAWLASPAVRAFVR